MVPSINTGMMRMLFVADSSGSDVEEEDIESFKEDGMVSEKIAEESRSAGVFNDRNFLDFAGDFSAEISDMESKIDINQLGSEGDNLQESPTAARLFALMSGEENDQWFLERNIDRWEMIGNLKDWIDQDTYRSGGLGGQEDSLYANQDPPYLSKNAKFDTTDEIRLVEGWHGELFEKFGDKLTIWSRGKFNLNSFDEEMHRALIRAAALSQPSDASLDMCFAGSQDSVLSVWDIASFNNGKDYASFVLSNCGIELDSSKITNVTKQSSVFEIVSTGMVGTSTVTITTIMDFSASGIGKVKYIRIE
jgi:type II secretory pathway component PulK